MENKYSQFLADSTTKSEPLKESNCQHKAPDNESDCLLLAFEKIEFLQEILDSTKQYLIETRQQLQATERELADTNRELCAALIPSEGLTFQQAKELAKKLVQSNTSASYCLAILIGAIYACPVQARELEPQDSQKPKDNRLRKKKNIDKTIDKAIDKKNHHKPTNLDECEKLGARLLMQV